MGVILDSSRNHGMAPVAASRYFALYLAQLGWIALGGYLLANAYWPTACRPHDLLEIYSCSGFLAEQQGWVESALMTWLWSTPILLALEVLRRFQKQVRR